jgi:hypothetical protein
VSKVQAAKFSLYINNVRSMVVVVYTSCVYSMFYAIHGGLEVMSIVEV